MKNFVNALITLSLLLLCSLSWALPHDPAHLNEAVNKYQQIVDDGGWPLVPEGSLLRQGHDGEAVDALVDRLLASGDLDKHQDQFNANVKSAVEKFQERHGLKIDGVVGPKTLAALNVTAQHRLDQLKATQERMTQVPLESDNFVLVNIPQYRMHYVEGGKSQLDMRVIVGKAAWDTPSMSDAIERIVFNPRWNLPVEIVAAELAPKVANDPDYLKKKNMTVVRGGFYSDDLVDPDTIDWANVREDNFPYFVYQSAGPDNPLGRMKFLFPNSDDIYLHDTPDKHLFGLENRARSHGCIRLEHPDALAEAILGDASKVESALAEESPVSVALDEALPVHLVYWTAWTDPEGAVHFREDIYDRV